MQSSANVHALPRSAAAPDEQVPSWKRPLDLFLLLLSLPVTGPLMLLLALWIRLLSSGPIFFMQERVGYRGRRFRCLKFRTMYHGCAAAPHEQHLARLVQEGKPMVKLDAIDTRLIPGARIVRALGLDELAQLINVFRGEMSWVGPRPCTPFELENYDPDQMERFDALPGLTGLWQVSGKNKTSFREMVDLDIRYLRNPSILEEFRIMAATPLVLAGQALAMVEARRQVRRTASTPAESFPLPSTRGARIPLGSRAVSSDVPV